MYRIDIIGNGNVAWHLSRAWTGGADVQTVSSRDFKDIRLDSDLYLLAVSDDAIGSVAKELCERIGGGKSIVAHVSGSVPMQVLIDAVGNTSKEGKQISVGVLYPLQTFTRGIEVDYARIPVFCEGDSESTLLRLSEAAGMWCRKVSGMSSADRRKLHLASVVTNNLSNHLWSLAANWLEKQGIDKTVLNPLIQETASKAIVCGPSKAQTGPAARGDKATIRKHIEMLADCPELQGIYKNISESIQKKFGMDS